MKDLPPMSEELRQKVNPFIEELQLIADLENKKDKRNTLFKLKQLETKAVNSKDLKKAGRIRRIIEAAKREYKGAKRASDSTEFGV